MEYRGAVFFDYDGTLADSHAGVIEPTNKTREAIQRLQENGYLAVLATGRAKCYLPDADISFRGYITTNGAYAEVNGACVHNACIPPQILREAMKYMDERGIMYALETQERCYAKDLSNPHFLEVIDGFHIDRNVFCLLDSEKLPMTNKLIVTHPDISIETGFMERFEGKLMMKRHRFCSSWDVDLYGMTKAVGMKAVMEAFGLKRSQIYAFGDGVNDYTMLKLAGHGIAMGEHAACLDEVAELVTGSVPEEGVYHALKRLGLIECI